MCEAICADVDNADPKSVQEVVDAALRRSFAASETLKSLFRGCPSGLVPSGRTDRGVHAHHLVAHCNCQATVDPDDSRLEEVALSLPAELNSQLPNDVRCRGVSWTADMSFCARGGSTKTYAYYIVQSKGHTQDSVEALAKAAWVLDNQTSELDLKSMKIAATHLVGFHDFLGFSSAPLTGNPATTEREIIQLEVHSQVEHSNFGLLKTCFANGKAVRCDTCPWCCKQGTQQEQSAEIFASQLLIIRVRGRGFLKHMVRRIVGFLVEVGKGRLQPSCVTDLLSLRRSIQGADSEECWRPPKAPAHGLWLEQVEVD